MTFCFQIGYKQSHAHYTYQFIALKSSKKFILETILSNDCDIKGSHERMEKE